MTNQSKHTPTLTWKEATVSKPHMSGSATWVYIRSGDHNLAKIQHGPGGQDTDPLEKGSDAVDIITCRAEMILSAVNSHAHLKASNAALVEALEKELIHHKHFMYHYVTQHGVDDYLASESALALAKEGAGE